MIRRFYAPKENFQPDDRIILSVEETRHLRDVLRLRENETVFVFDGENREFSCRIEKIGKRETVLKIIEETNAPAITSDLELTLVVAILKGDKFDFVIQKAVELGVSEFIPLLTKRAEVRPKNIQGKIERWRKIIIESSKQCGRADLMKLTEPTEFADFIKTADGAKILFAETGGEKFASLSESKKITAATGAEGGWETSEIEAARKKGFQIITFGGRIMRAETAAVAVAAVLQHRFGDLR